MHDQAFTILEYNQLRHLVRREAQTPMGGVLIDSLKPIEDQAVLSQALNEVAECVALRNRGVSWSFGDLPDPGESFARLRVEGAALSSTAILTLADICGQAMVVRTSLVNERPNVPHLWEVVRELPIELNSLVARISNKILPTGGLDDRASPELARVRHEITRLRSNITRLLENLMRRSDEAIQDELVTVRNDRFVIPVKADHRGRVRGVAHGSSSSGATVFVEPMETIDANNELQSLREAEEREIARILNDLSEELRAQLPALEMSAHAVSKLDFINAKARFSQRFDCVLPDVSSDSGTLSFLEARHPLLVENLKASGKGVVPVSFTLDRDHATMVISGANAGGKTVVLKTAGLLSLMALSALPVPARAAQVPLYRSVLADIGDHQSLAANLSTFTSHVSNISRMIESCEAPALVLLDEVGTGTDPEEGSALGVAVVDHFRRCGAHVIATTHYRGLKMYAAREEGVINASVEFDERTLQPTYRLIVGVAGSSSGLEIAHRFGIPKPIIDSAAQFVSETSREAVSYLARIKNDSDQIAALRLALEDERAAVAEKYEALERVAAKNEAERQAAFQEQLQKTVADFEVQARESIARMENQAERVKLERESKKRVAELKRKAVRAISNPSERETDVAAKRPIKLIRHGQAMEKSGDAGRYIPSERTQLAVGDKVRLRSFGSIGKVEQLKGDEAEVRVKALRFREKLVNLELVEEVQVPKTGSRGHSSPNIEVRLHEAPASTPMELKVIGQRADEAIDAVDKFLDAAALNNLSHVRIVHGHGTGALRRAISQFLETHPHVETFAQAPSNQGGAGATVVELRQ